MVTLWKWAINLLQLKIIASYNTLEKDNLLKSDIKIIDIKTVGQNGLLQEIKQKSDDIFIENGLHQVNESLVISFM